MNNQGLLPRVIEVAEEAGKVLLELQPRAKEIRGKGKDFLTDADIRSDALISKRLKEISPKIPIYSEEAEIAIKEKGRMWIIDPLDGSVNFTRQDVWWGVAIALIENQKVQLAVIYLPALQRLVGASREGEVIARGVDIQMSPETALSRALVWTSWSKKSKEQTVSAFSRLAETTLYPQIRSAAAADFLALVRGQIAGFVCPGIAIEDRVAGAFIVEMTGGKVTDFAGNPITIFSDSIIASNGLLHSQLLEAFKR